MEIIKKITTNVKDQRQQEDMAASIAELKELAIELAGVEVEAGTIELEDIPENLQEELRDKMDADKKLEL